MGGEDSELLAIPASIPDKELSDLWLFLRIRVLMSRLPGRCWRMANHHHLLVQRMMKATTLEPLDPDALGKVTPGPGPNKKLSSRKEFGYVFER